MRHLLPAVRIPHVVLGLLIAPVLCVSVPEAWSEELYQQRFNEEDILLLDGAQLGPDGSGASGKPGDKAYTAGGEATPKAIAVIPSNAVPARTNVEELTVTAWYKPAAGQTDAATLFSALGSVLIWDNAKKHWVWRIEAAKIDGSTSPYWFYLSDPPSGEWMKLGDWTFIALAWNKNAGTVRFYQGGSSAEPVSGRELTRKDQVEPLAFDNNRKHTIGNDRLKTERAFGGEIDNVRFYDKALGDDAIAAIYKADLANEAPKLP